jgi:hypothetical protein
MDLASIWSEQSKWTSERFQGQVYPDPNSGCFLWAGSATPEGYGNLRVGSHVVYAHRIAWILSGRRLPDHLQILHKCDTPCCVNPDHLFPGSAVVNLRDMALKERGRKSEKGLPYGVTRHGRGFRARTKIRGKRYCMGTYPTIEEAAAAALQGKRAVYGAGENP